jgi:putative transposase
MSRKPRRFEPGVPYHLISRFVDREWFITRPNEREHYLELLGRALEESDWRMLAFAVMSNHIHLAAIAGRQQLGSWIRRVHSPFAGAMNVAYNRIGPMFVRGPKAYSVDGGRIGHLVAYIHNNPVRAGLASRAVESDWTSHRAYVRAADAPRWLHVGDGLLLSNVSQGSTFDDWVADPARTNDERFTEADHEQELARRREQEAAEQRAQREREPQDEVADTIASVAAEVCGVSRAQLRSRARGEREVLARSAAIHYATSRGLTEQTIARALCISQQRVSIVRRCEPSDRIRRTTSCIDLRLQPTTVVTPGQVVEVVH